jgi:DnaK suppressor protein
MTSSLKDAIKNLGTQEYMSESQKEVFHTHLTQEYQRLSAHQESLLLQLKNISNDGADDCDMAFNIDNQKSLQSEIAKTRLTIQKIGLSLSAIKSDEYGFCSDCGSEIGLNRMIAQPIASRDIDCSTLFEIKNKTQFNGNLKIA